MKCLGRDPPAPEPAGVQRGAEEAHDRGPGPALGRAREHGESEAALRHVRRHFITVDNLRAAVTRLVNGTFAARDGAWWGQGTACASDSKKFGSWSSNFMTEYHARYGGNGVHGASVVGFAFTELLNFRLLPRLKNIGSIRLYRPDTSLPGGRRSVPR